MALTCPVGEGLQVMWHDAENRPVQLNLTTRRSLLCLSGNYVVSSFPYGSIAPPSHIRFQNENSTEQQDNLVTLEDAHFLLKGAESIAGPQLCKAKNFARQFLLHALIRESVRTYCVKTIVLTYG